MKIGLAAWGCLIVAGCTSVQSQGGLSASDCKESTESMHKRAEQAWAQAVPAQAYAKAHPESDEAKIAAEDAMQKAASAVADIAKQAADIDRGRCGEG